MQFLCHIFLIQSNIVHCTDESFTRFTSIHIFRHKIYFLYLDYFLWFLSKTNKTEQISIRIKRWFKLCSEAEN